MRKHWSGRVGQYAAVLLLAIMLNFALPRAMPGSPLAHLAGEDVGLLPPEVLEEIRARHGLDLPLTSQFLRYLSGLSRGDLGYSFQRGRPVGEIIGERLPWTLLLVGTALLAQTVLGVALGAKAAWSRGKTSDFAVMTAVMMLRSMPSFWIAMILLAIFAAGFGWFPMYGSHKPWAGYTGLAHLVDVARHLVLPAVSLLLIGTAETFMTMRYSMLEVLGEDYIRTARAKGLEEHVVLYKHAGRNALLPVATVFMLGLGFAVGGATVIETVFAYPGVGRLMYEAVLARDYPLLQACFLIVTVAVVLANLLADLVYPLLDPRVRVQ